MLAAGRPSPEVLPWYVPILETLLAVIGGPNGTLGFAANDFGLDAELGTRNRGTPRVIDGSG